MTQRSAPIAITTALVAGAVSGTALAQWDPGNGSWGKVNPTDIRVMTWNVEDMLRTENPLKGDQLSNWNACSRIVAGLRPDVLILQETGDNGCGGCVDSVSELETVVGLFFNGGADPFVGGTVTTYLVDVADRDAVYAFAQEIETLGGADIVINNAGVAQIARVDELTYEDFEWVMNIDFWGMVYGTKAFLPQIQKKGEGHIVYSNK